MIETTRRVWENAESRNLLGDRMENALVVIDCYPNEQEQAAADGGYLDSVDFYRSPGNALEDDFHWCFWRARERRCCQPYSEEHFRA